MLWHCNYTPQIGMLMFILVIELTVYMFLLFKRSLIFPYVSAHVCMWGQVCITIFMWMS